MNAGPKKTPQVATSKVNKNKDLGMKSAIQVAAPKRMADTMLDVCAAIAIGIGLPLFIIFNF